MYMDITNVPLLKMRHEIINSTLENDLMGLFQGVQNVARDH
jgi:hypothetical protein